MDKKKIIIDCDPGVDDAMAILFAMAHPGLEVLALTAVAGNGPLEMTARNACKLAELGGRPELPVYAGCDKPLTREQSNTGGSEIHGQDCLGDIGLPEAKKGAEARHAVDYILDTLRGNPAGTITILALGPMTNLAQAVQKDSEAFGRAAAIYSMGGSVLCGNMTPVAEFNYWADPEAVDIVFKSGVPFYMVGLNATEQVRLMPEHQERLCASKKNGAAALGKMLPVLMDFDEKVNGTRYTVPHDLLAAQAIVAPELFGLVHCHVEISTTALTRGECLADLVDAWKQPKNCYVAMSAQEKELLDLFFETVL